MNESVLGDQVDHLVLARNLHGNREVVRRLGGEVNVDCALLEDRVRGLVVDLHNVKLCASCRTVCECEELGVCRRILQAHGAKCGSVTFDRLADSTIPRV